MPTPNLQAEHTPALTAALRDLERTLEAFIDALGHDAGPALAAGAATPRESLRRICGAYASIDYGQDDPVNHSTVCLGVVGALNSDLQNLDQALQHISNVRSQVGAISPNSRWPMPTVTSS